MSTTWNSEDSFWKRTVAYSAAAVAVVAAGGALNYFKFMSPSRRRGKTACHAGA